MTNPIKIRVPYDVSPERVKEIDLYLAERNAERARKGLPRLSRNALIDEALTRLMAQKKPKELAGG